MGSELSANRDIASPFLKTISYVPILLAIRQKLQPDVWTTFNTQSMLGGAKLGQKKYAEAEPLLIQGYQGMKDRKAKIPKQFRAARLTEALERLVALYEATGKRDAVAIWRKELEAIKQMPEPKK